MNDSLFAGIEAGGTKVLCAVANNRGEILMDVRIPTTTPDQTFAQVAAFFAAQEAKVGAIKGCGIASFGPLDLDQDSESYGHLTTTPKLGWKGVDMLGRLTAILPVPTLIDTDVNCAALAEGMSGAATGLERFCYMTVGTGIGVGIIDVGRATGGAGHPEVGHIRVARAPGDGFAGICPSHGDCVEGLACGPAMKARWHASAEDLPSDHVAWEYEAHYIASICLSLTYITRPQRIIIGGGVLERSSLYAGIRSAFVKLTAGYALDSWAKQVETYLSAPGLSQPSPGLVGALAMARKASDAS